MLLDTSNQITRLILIPFLMIFWYHYFSRLKLCRENFQIFLKSAKLFLVIFFVDKEVSRTVTKMWQIEMFFLLLKPSVIIIKLVSLLWNERGRERRNMWNILAINRIIIFQPSFLALIIQKEVYLVFFPWIAVKVITSWYRLTSYRSLCQNFIDSETLLVP